MPPDGPSRQRPRGDQRSRPVSDGRAGERPGGRERERETPPGRAVGSGTGVEAALSPPNTGTGTERGGGGGVSALGAVRSSLPSPGHHRGGNREPRERRWLPGPDCISFQPPRLHLPRRPLPTLHLPAGRSPVPSSLRGGGSPGLPPQPRDGKGPATGEETGAVSLILLPPRPIPGPLNHGEVTSRPPTLRGRCRDPLPPPSPPKPADTPTPCTGSRGAFTRRATGAVGRHLHACPGWVARSPFPPPLPPWSCCF